MLVLLRCQAKFEEEKSKSEKCERFIQLKSNRQLSATESTSCNRGHMRRDTMKRLCRVEFVNCVGLSLFTESREY